MKNTTPCGFCKGTGIEPGETNCIWCDNTGIDWAGRPGDIPVAIPAAIMPAVDPLRIALEHIQKTVGQSRTQTRRLRWIGKRAELALAGRPYVASEHELPPNGDSEHFKLLRQKTALKDRVDLLEGALGKINLRLNAYFEADQDMPLHSVEVCQMIVDAALKPTERTNTSGNAHCPHDGICHTSDETCAEAQARIDSISPNDLSIYTYRSKPKTGGFDNSPDDGIAILHRPSGIETRCHEHRSSHANSSAAMKELRNLVQAFEPACAFCFVQGCNGECSGDGAMGD